MSTERTDGDRTEPTDRLYPLESALPEFDRPAWQRISPDLSGGWKEIHQALECHRSNITAEDVTST